MSVDYKPVDVEIAADNSGMFHVFEMRKGMNKFDHRFLALLKRTRQMPTTIRYSLTDAFQKDHGLSYNKKAFQPRAPLLSP